jgi:hypothetical protein
MVIAMDNNRRRYLRSRVIKSGKLVLGPYTIACVVRNVSGGGVCVDVDSGDGLPTVFKFSMPDQPPRAAKAVWQNGKRLGVEFQ